jgi:Na+-transporting NADH:ubiquinone oxidoreductase subunit NqrC
MPKKRIFDRLMDLSDMVHNDDDEPQSQREKSQKNRQQIDALYSVTADILSNNLAREKITAEWVGEMMDVQDLKDFLQEYAKFAKQEAANPN